MKLILKEKYEKHDRMVSVPAFSMQCCRARELESTIRMLRITTLLFGFGNNASAFVLMYPTLCPSGQACGFRLVQTPERVIVDFTSNLFGSNEK